MNEPSLVFHAALARVAWALPRAVSVMSGRKLRGGMGGRGQRRLLGWSLPARPPERKSAAGLVPETRSSGVPGNISRAGDVVSDRRPFNCTSRGTAAVAFPPVLPRKLTWKVKKGESEASGDAVREEKRTPARPSCLIVDASRRGDLSDRHYEAHCH